MAKKRHKRKTLYQQIQEILVSKQKFGSSKRFAKKEKESSPWIYSVSTYQSYRKHCFLFASWLKNNHPECTSIRKARQYISDYMDYRKEKGLSSWTLALDYSALVKLYDIKKDDPDRYALPKRRRVDIKRSRGESKRSQDYSPITNKELLDFCHGVGPRRSELLSMRGKDLYDRDRINDEISKIESFPPELLDESDRIWLKELKQTLLYNRDEHYWVRIKGKGGKIRLAVVLPRYEETVVQRFKARDPEERIWHHVNTKIDYHKLRSQYATNLYLRYARPIDEIPFDAVTDSGRRYKSQVYYCRSDESGKCLDKHAVQFVSWSLGHNRLDTAITNYIR